MEGSECFGGGECAPGRFSPPAVEFGHDIGCSVTGGFVYRGKAIPALDGIYFYADWCSGLLRGFRWRNGVVSDHWDWKPSLDPQDRLSSIASFGRDAVGELYIVSLDGTLFKLVPGKESLSPSGALPLNPTKSLGR